MFYYLVKKEFINASVLIVFFGLFLFYIDFFTESVVSYLIGQNFYYQEQPFLKLIYLLLLAVSIGIFSGLNRNTTIKDSEKKSLSSGYVLSIIVATLIGLGIHIYFVVNEMNEVGSLYELEESIFIYYLTDFFMVLGFIFGGLKVRQRII